MSQYVNFVNPLRLTIMSLCRSKLLLDGNTTDGEEPPVALKKEVRPQGVAESSDGKKRPFVNPNRLKIVGGTAKGKGIDSPDVYLRPMMSKV